MSEPKKIRREAQGRMRRRTSGTPSVCPKCRSRIFKSAAAKRMGF